MTRTKKKINDSNKLDNNNLNNDNQCDNLSLQNISCDKNENQVNMYECDIITINEFKKKEKMLYEVLNNFFNQCSLPEVKMMIEIIDSDHTISLRFLDWFVTRYCYLYKLSIPINNNYNKEQIFNINISYKAQLKSFKKRYFDPFRRKKKFIYNFGKHELNILTTLGQLNFFRWALSYEIIKYAENNFKNITNKIVHVNSYFKKNTIDSNSLTITTSDENNNSTNKKTLSDTSTTNLSDTNPNPNTSDENIKLSQTDIDLLMGTNNNNSIGTIKKKTNKASKVFNELKNSQPILKYPQVSRNICIEF